MGRLVTTATRSCGVERHSMHQRSDLCRAFHCVRNNRAAGGHAGDRWISCGAYSARSAFPGRQGVHALSTQPGRQNERPAGLFCRCPRGGFKLLAAHAGYTAVRDLLPYTCTDFAVTYSDFPGHNWRGFALLAVGTSSRLRINSLNAGVRIGMARSRAYLPPGAITI